MFSKSSRFTKPTLLSKSLFVTWSTQDILSIRHILKASSLLIIAILSPCLDSVLDVALQQSISETEIWVFILQKFLRTLPELASFCISFPDLGLRFGSLCITNIWIEWLVQCSLLSSGRLQISRTSSWRRFCRTRLKLDLAAV